MGNKTSKSSAVEKLGEKITEHEIFIKKKGEEMNLVGKDNNVLSNQQCGEVNEILQGIAMTTENDINEQLLFLLKKQLDNVPVLDAELCKKFFLRYGEKKYVFLGVLVGCSNAVKSKIIDICKEMKEDKSLIVVDKNYILELLKKLDALPDPDQVTEGTNEVQKLDYLPSCLFNILCRDSASSYLPSTPNEEIGSPFAISEMLGMYYRETLGLTNAHVFGPLVVPTPPNILNTNREKIDLITRRPKWEENSKAHLLPLCFRLAAQSIQSIEMLLKKTKGKNGKTLYHSDMVEVVSVEKGLDCLMSDKRNIKSEVDMGESVAKNTDVFVCHGHHFKFIVKVNTFMMGGKNHAVLQIIFKGTSSVKETLTDLRFNKSGVAINDEAVGIGEAYEHKGINELLGHELLYLEPFLKKVITRIIMQKCVENVSIVVSGQSLGGALSQLLGMRIKRLMMNTVASVRMGMEGGVIKSQSESERKQMNLKFIILAIASPRCFNAVEALILLDDVINNNDMVLMLLENPFDTITGIPKQAQGTCKPIGAEIKWSAKYGMLLSPMKKRLEQLLQKAEQKTKARALNDFFTNTELWENFDPRVMYNGKGMISLPKKRSKSEAAKYYAKHMIPGYGLVSHSNYPPYVSYKWGGSSISFSLWANNALEAWKPKNKVTADVVLFSWPHNNLTYAIDGERLKTYKLIETDKVVKDQGISLNEPSIKKPASGGRKTLKKYRRLKVAKRSQKEKSKKKVAKRKTKKKRV